MSISSELIHVFIMYYDETVSFIPLFSYPDEIIKMNDESICPIKYHPIWFLELEDHHDFEHIDITYKGKVYCAKKYKVFSKRSAIRPEFRNKIFDIIVIIIVLPKVMDSFKLNFLNIISEILIGEFKTSFYKIIESEILKENLIRTPKVMEIIKIGESLKYEIKTVLKNIWDVNFAKIMTYYQNYYINST